MSAGNPFKVELVGSFYSFQLYDEFGREIFELSAAIEEAEKQFGTDWNCVYNGSEGAEREDS